MDESTVDETGRMSAERFYDVTAEYVAVLLPAAWTVLGPAVADALAGLDPSGGPVVDVGAGTGLGTRVIASALPAAEILAVEPHPALRTALLAVVAAEEDLRRRVTVLDTDLLSAALPGRLSGLVAANVLGHFTPPDRDRIWQLLANRLAPGGRAVLTLSPPLRPELVPPTPMGEATLGRRRYAVTAAAEPAGSDAVTWTMTYQVREADAVVARSSARDFWHVLAPDELATEVERHGLRLTRSDPDTGLQVLTR